MIPLETILTNSYNTIKIKQEITVAMNRRHRSRTSPTAVQNLAFVNSKEHRVAVRKMHQLHASQNAENQS